MLKAFWDEVGVYLYIVCMIIGTIAGLIVMISMFVPDSINIHTWQAVLIFSVGTLLWLIPVQIIYALKFIPIQRRKKRMLFPYFLTLVQVTAFSLYVIGLNSMLSGISFSNGGLIAFITIILFYTKLLKDRIVKYEQMLRQEQNKSLG
ncbi:MAG: hypothetical protein LRY73_11345 [Bacillus sp. (in: Bacteria)]|nr:hypothetical protein [Bacillus sp. (in: firmicutes)]